MVWNGFFSTGIMTIKSKYRGIDPRRARLGGFICHMGFPPDREGTNSWNERRQRINHLISPWQNLSMGHRLGRSDASTKHVLYTDFGTPPLLEGSEPLLLEFWSGSEERLSRFFGGLKGGELPSFHCLSTPLHDIKEASS